MMKKLLSLTLAVGLVFLFGCGKQDTTLTPSDNEQESTQRTKYESAKDGFSIQYPNSRTFQENVYESSVMFFTPITGDDTIQENVGIIKKVLDKDYTLDDYYTITKPELMRTIPGFVEVTTEKIKINDIDTQKTIYKGTEGTYTLEWQQIYLIKDKQLYIITYTATAATFDQYLQQVNQMAATLEVQ